MKQTILLDNIPINIINSSRAKNIKIRIKAADQVELILPQGRFKEKGIEFIKEKMLWIKNKTGKILTSQLQTTELETNKTLSILDQPYEIILECKNITKPIEVIDNKIHISSSIRTNKIIFILAPFIKKLVYEEIITYSDSMAKKIGVSYNRISLRDTITRWGSCSTTGNLSFSWRLALAPKFVLHYVIVHELCHLVEMNHSVRFWNLVKLHFPEFNQAKSWLKINGKKLHKLL